MEVLFPLNEFQLIWS